MPTSGMSFAMIAGGRAALMRSAIWKPGWPKFTFAESLIACFVFTVPNVITWAILSSPQRSAA